MGAAPEVRLVIKHTFLEFVEEEAPFDKPLRPRAFTDSALANEHTGHRQQPLNGDADRSACSPQELPWHQAPCGAATSSASSALNSDGLRVNRDATEEVKAVLGMAPHGRGEAPSPALASGRGPPGGRNGAARRPPRGERAGAGDNATDMPVLRAAAPALPPRGSPWTTPMHVRPTAPGAGRGGASSSRQAVARARPAQRGSVQAAEAAEPRARPEAEDGARSAAGAPEDQLTTVLFRNLPRSFTRAMFLDLVDSEGFAGSYDFVYTPVDFTSRAGLGYAFIDFALPAVARRFWDRFDGYSKWTEPNDKAGALNWSSPHQGLAAHVERYRNSPVMHATVPDEWKPAVFADGVRVAFPAPTKPIKAPKIRHVLGGGTPSGS
uniref:Mei2-like C-terminal RNA recognition motif domain-containing protein n=1 Tax=Alexandrium monilatum TaxID=311494 RepID=A0A7S4QCN2_9DINO